MIWSARGPGFESRLGHVLFPPLLHLVAQYGSVRKGTVSLVSGMVLSRCRDEKLI